MFKVSSKGEYPKPKRIIHKEIFNTRQQARQWCRNRYYLLKDLIIIHPNGIEEKYGN